MTSNNKSQVSVIVLNYNGRNLLPDCLESLMKQTYKSLEIMMVDNNSSDESVSYVTENFPDVKILKLDRNYGFAVANNKGASKAKGEYIMLLNNDTIADPKLIENLVTQIKESNAMVVGPKILMYPSKSIMNGLGISMNLMGFAWDRGIGEPFIENMDIKPYEVFGASGGCMLFNRKILEETELFDERYWIYYEDVDFSWRVRLLSHKVMVVPSAILYHKFRISMEKRRSERLFHQEKNRICNLLKNYNLKNLARYLALNLFHDFKRCFIALLKGNEKSRDKAFQRFRAYIWNLLNIAGTLKKRSKIQSRRKISDDELLKILDGSSGSHPVLIPDYRIMDLESFKLKGVKVDKILMGKNDFDVLGYGWSESVDINDGIEYLTCRKCGDDAVFYLTNHDNFQKIGIDLISVTGDTVYFEILVNEKNLGNFHVGSRKFKFIEVSVPSETSLKNEFLECRILVNTEKAKHEKYNSYDPRTFYLAINKVIMSK